MPVARAMEDRSGNHSPLFPRTYDEQLCAMGSLVHQAAHPSSSRLRMGMSPELSCSMLATYTSVGDGVSCRTHQVGADRHRLLINPAAVGEELGFRALGWLIGV